jgi:hypothetical protein
MTIKWRAGRAAARVLDQLDGVRATGAGRWIARCPAHQDRTPSLSVRETDEGRVLLHDFGGCHTGDVVVAMGLSLADLFDQPLGHRHAPSKTMLPAREVLTLVSHEVDVVLILLTEALERGGANDAVLHRLAKAASRIGTAMGHIHGR